MSYVKVSENIYFGLHPSIVFPEPFNLGENSVFINLTEANEFPDYKTNIETFSFPIIDRKVPSRQVLVEILKQILTEMAVNKKIYIFCKGGHGRSGTIVSILYGLVNNLDGKKSMEIINGMWKVQRDMSKLKPVVKKLGCPQTKIQKDTVVKFLQNIPIDIYEKLLSYHIQRALELSKIMSGKVTMPSTKVEPSVEVEEETPPEFLFFWSHNTDTGYLSNWYKSSFSIDGIDFTTVEKYMMYSKAKLMGDEEIAKEILRINDPAKIKKLGRKVKNWDEDRWVNNRERIVSEALFGKFSQNEELKKKLLKTKGSILVEAAPNDKIWGIGMRSTNKNATQPEKWKGLNLLGKCLMATRDKLE